MDILTDSTLIEFVFSVVAMYGVEFCKRFKVKTETLVLAAIVLFGAGYMVYSIYLDEATKQNIMTSLLAFYGGMELAYKYLKYRKKKLKK